MKFNRKSILISSTIVLAFLVLFIIPGKFPSTLSGVNSQKKVDRSGFSTIDGSGNYREQARSKSKRKLTQITDRELEEGFIDMCRGVKGEVEESLMDAYIESLLERGGFKKALGLITNNLGEGRERENLLIRLGLASTLSIEEAMSEFLKIESPNDQDAFKQGLFRRFGGNEWDLESVNRLLSLSDDVAENNKMLKMAFLYGLKVNGAGDQDPLAYLSLRFSQISQLEGLAAGQKSELKNLLLKFTSEIDPFEAMAKTSDLGATLDPSVQNEIIAAMFRRDPAKSLEVLLNKQDAGDAIQIAFGIMARNDLTSALSTYEQKLSSFSTSQKEQAVTAFSKYYSETGTWDQANNWASRLADPSLRKTVEGQVWTAQRNSLRNEVAGNPSGTLQSIITNQSKYADYWLEEAMTTWVSRDFDDAVAWHEKNWDSLSTDKAQYVAAAFAKHALQQQDVETARQWAALIHDPKTKARINENIAKAAAGQ